MFLSALIFFYSMPYRLLDHPADVIVAVDSDTLEGLLADAGRALFAVMLDVDAVEPLTRKEFSVEGADEEDLLYSFLEELLVFKDAESLAFSRFEVGVREGGEGLRADVAAYGERIRPEHNPRSDVKAISWHGFKVWKDGDGWHARVLLDV